ncbi:MAG: PLDc N-terminal domain-containing protein [Actinobacteria bacterium]|nr:PLDc N-terminal domain-containing protein [Actinomycetota bacterium]
MSGIYIADITQDATAAFAGTVIAGLAGLWIFLIVLISGIALFFFIFWIIMLVDCIKRKPEEFPDGGQNSKTLWIILLTVTFFLGNSSGIAAIVYYFVVKKKAPQKEKI